MKTIDWLRGREWSMGNGQCPECYGLGPPFAREKKWTGLDRGPYGHKVGCQMAQAIAELGGIAVGPGVESDRN